MRMALFHKDNKCTPSAFVGIHIMAGAKWRMRLDLIPKNNCVCSPPSET